MTTIKDIAKASGVSYPTVSHVLNKTRSVSPKTRQKVMDAVKALNYHPNAVARGLLKKQMNTIGVIFPYAPVSLISHHHLGPLMDGILAVSHQFHQSAMLFTADTFPENPERLSLYCDGRSDGLLVVGQPSDSPFVQSLRASRTPFVCINECWEDADIPFVDVDQAGSAERLVSYLIERGHLRIGVLTGDDDAIAVAQRLRGYRNALAAHGIASDETLILHGHYTEESGYEAAHRLVSNRAAVPLPTALFCHNDLIALGALRAFAELNVRVPEDISVAGFDDIPGAAASNPPLTTMHLPMRALGEQATRLLMDQIETPGTTATRELLPTELIERQSVALI